MDPVRETQKSFDSLLDNEDDSFDAAYWVEAVWKRDDALNICQNGLRERIHNDRVESFELYIERRIYVVRLGQLGQPSSHCQRKKELMWIGWIS